MPYSTTVNPQVTDAVTSSNVKVVTEASAMGLSNVYPIRRPYEQD